MIWDWEHHNTPYADVYVDGHLLPEGAYMACEGANGFADVALVDVTGNAFVDKETNELSRVRRFGHIVIITYTD